MGIVQITWTLFGIYSLILVAMAKADSLFQLISSLNSSEKRLFKMYVTTNSGGKEAAYLDLFDAYGKLNVFSESGLISKLPKSYAKKNLGQQKKYLKDLILKCMRDKDDNRAEDNINELMREHVFLGKKNLVKEQWKKLQKAKEIAEKYELASRSMEILDAEMSFLIEREFNESLKFREQYEKERNDKLEWIKQYNQLVIVKNQIFQLLRRFRKSIDEENLQFADSLIENLDTDIIFSFRSFKLQRLYFTILANHADLHERKSDVLENRAKLIQLYEEYPWMVAKQKKNLLVDHFNYISSLFGAEQFEQMKVQLDELEKISLTNENDKGEFFQNITLNKILYWVNTKNLDEAAQAEESIEKGVQQYRNKINSSSLVTLYFNYALAFFCNEKFEECIDWLERIEEIKEEVRKDLRVFAKVFIILCHYELGNLMLIESLVRSLRRKEKLHTAHAKVLSSVLALSNGTNETMRDVLEELQKEINGFDSFVGKNLTNLWLDGKVKYKSIKEAYISSL